MGSIRENEAIAAPSGGFGSRRDRWLALLHPTVIVGASLVLAGGLFLSGTELRLPTGSDSALLKLIAGAAFLSVIGMFFGQQSVFRIRHEETRADLRRTSDDLAAMKRSLDAHLRNDGGQAG
ncbi:MAG: hypothetical protein AB7K86_05800 [Rhodospirillales bacterium]